VLGAFDCGFRAPFLTAFEVVGASGAVRPANPYKPGLESQVEVTDADGDRRVITTGGEELYSGEIEDLARAVLDGATPRMTLEDSRGNAAALVALYESARTGRPVTVGRA
jgi:predicted dehydrogenase